LREKRKLLKITGIKNPLVLQLTDFYRTNNQIYSEKSSNCVLWPNTNQSFVFLLDGHILKWLRRFILFLKIKNPTVFKTVGLVYKMLLIKN